MFEKILIKSFENFQEILWMFYMLIIQFWYKLTALFS